MTDSPLMECQAADSPTVWGFRLASALDEVLIGVGTRWWEPGPLLSCPLLSLDSFHCPPHGKCGHLIPEQEAH